MHRVSVRTLCAPHLRHASTSSSAPAAKPNLNINSMAKRASTKPASHSNPEEQHLKKVIRFVDNIIEHSQDSGRMGWKHMPSRRGEEIRLKQTVRAAGKKHRSFIPTSKELEASFPSMSKQIFDSPVEVEQLEQQQDVSLAPEAPVGSFVEVRRNDLVDCGVIVGSGFRDRKWKYAILTREGSSWVVMQEDCFFTIPSLCPTDLATRCGLSIQPANDIELNARVEVLRQMRDIQREIENAVVGISPKLASVYDLVRSKDPEAWGQVTLSEVAGVFFKNPTAIELFATHKVLMDAVNQFVVGHSYASAQTFIVRPLEEVKNLQRVRGWVRGNNAVLEGFAARAKAIMRVQEQLVKETMAEAPGDRPAKHRWTEADKTIIRFLKSSLRHVRSVQPDPYSVAVGFILRRFYKLDQIEHYDDHVHKLLVAIAELPPWQDLVTIDRSNKIDKETRPAVLAERERGILRALENSKDPNPVHPDDFYPSDPLESIRHDWGDMPVYVVDDAGAEELDDGISVERIPSEPGNTWIHIHIADPTSIIPSTNFLAETAAQQHETLYLVPKSYPLLPKCLTFHPTRGMSLGVRSQSGNPDSVLTFSAKVNAEGDIIDYTVKAGLARNVKIIDYDSVDAALGVTFGGPEYPFGNAPVKPPPRTLDSQTLEDLKLLTKVAEAQQIKVMAMNWFGIDQPKSRVERVEEFPADPNPDTRRLYHGFPKLRYMVINGCDDSGSRVTIAEMMKLACRIASMFFTEKNVPALRRVSNPMVPGTEEAINLILRSRNARGFVNGVDVLQEIIYSPVAMYSTQPGMHWGLGVPEGQGYVRVTSPLRRYGDLLAHWQIQKVLLQEIEGSPVKGLYDPAWMEKSVGSMAVKDQFLKSTFRRHNRFWSLMHIKRWQELFAEGKNQHLWPKDANGEPIQDPLENLEAIITSMPSLNSLTKDMQSLALMPKLGMIEMLRSISVDERESVKIGQRVPVKIREIRLGSKPLMVLDFDRSRC